MVTVEEKSNLLGYTGWYSAHLLIKRIHHENGIDIKSSDNKYHLAHIVGGRITGRAYSEHALELLRKVKDGQPYELDIPST